MKNIQNNILAALLVTLLIGACTKDFDETNANPNAPEQVPGTTLLLSGITTGIFTANSYYEFHAGGLLPTASPLWCQHYTMTGYNNVDKYAVTPFDFVVEWPGVYSGALQDLQALIADPKNGDNLRAAAMVMRAFLFSVQADLYGDIPYFSALDVANTVQPEYNSQESIYKDLTAQLAQAAGLFDLNGDALGSGDVLYGGDVLKWKKLANTLRARLLNRYKHLDATAAQRLQTLLNDPAGFPVFESNADNAALVPTGEQPYVSPVYQLLTVSANNAIPVYASSATMIDILKSLNDPRLPVYAEPTTLGDFIGRENGSTLPLSTDSVSFIGKYFTANPQLPIPVLNYAELLFIKAEALNDRQAYLDGIAAAMSPFNLVPDDTYLDAAKSAWNANPLEAIIKQKWIALFLNGNEAYTEFRRTGYPSEIHEALNSVHPGLGVPHRYAYPPIEETTNGDNLQAAKGRQHIVGGLEMYGDKMWWAK